MPDLSIMTHSNDSPGAVRGGAETRDQDDQETFWFYFSYSSRLNFSIFLLILDSLDLIFKKIKKFQMRRLFCE